MYFFKGKRNYEHTKKNKLSGLEYTKNARRDNQIAVKMKKGFMEEKNPQTLPQPSIMLSF